METMDKSVLKPELSGFSSFKLRIHNHVCALSVSQGEQEALVIKGPSGLLSRIQTEVKGGCLGVELGGRLSDRIGDAFSTSLTRQKVEIDLIARELQSLDIAGFVEGVVFAPTVNALSLTFAGLGSLKVLKLQVDSLDVTLKGSPTMQIDGAAETQRVTVKGMGQYRAGNLKTHKSVVHLSGSAFATLWAEDDLKIEMQGMGSVEYYGQPTISRKTIGMNNLKPLGVR